MPKISTTVKAPEGKVESWPNIGIKADGGVLNWHRQRNRTWFAATTLEKQRDGWVALYLECQKMAGLWHKNGQPTARVFTYERGKE